MKTITRCIPILALCSILAFALISCGGGGGGSAPATPATPGGASTVTAQSPADIANCPDGGIKLDYGIDDNNNGKLDIPGEVDGSEYICDGADGAPGQNSLTDIAAIGSGPECAYGGLEISVGIDSNGNGTLDSAETTSTDYVCNGIGGYAAVVYSSKDTPVSIPDADVSLGLSSKMHVSGGITSIAYLRVFIDILHGNVGDLKLVLNSPAGTEILLSDGNGSDGSNYAGTVFDDGAQVAIADGSASFSGYYRPEQGLSAFNGENSNGDWTLHVYDKVTGNTGSLEGWQIEVSDHEPPVAVLGFDQKVAFGETVSLDGSASSSAITSNLIYNWAFVSKPQGSASVFLDPAAVNPTFTVDSLDYYKIELVVSDGSMSSIPDTLVVNPSITLTGSGFSNSSINIQWSDIVGVEGYSVERSDNGVDFAEITTVGPDVFNYTNADLPEGTTYQYRVRAYSGGLYSEYSNTTSAVTKLNYPMYVSFDGATDTLSWVDNSSLEDGFQIWGKNCTSWRQSCSGWPIETCHSVCNGWSSWIKRGTAGPDMTSYTFGTTPTYMAVSAYNSLTESKMLQPGNGGASEGAIDDPVDVTGLTPYDGETDAWKGASYYMTGVTPDMGYSIYFTGLGSTEDITVYDSGTGTQDCSPGFGGNSSACTFSTPLTEMFIEVLSSSGYSMYTFDILPNVAEGTTVDPLDVTGLTSYAGTVGITNSYYVASITSATSYNISLTGLSGNADLYVYDNDSTFSTPVCSSERGSVTREDCSVTATGTEMYVLVNGVSSTMGAAYTLDIQ